MLSRLRKSVPALLLGGVLALGFGAWMSRGLMFDTTTAAVENCVHHNSKQKANSLRGSYVSCRVAWTTSDGKKHTDIVDFDGRNDLAGTKQEIAVHGDDAMGPGDTSNGVLFIGAGVVMLGGGVLLRRAGSTRASLVNEQQPSVP
jgi:hypothetical protein